MNERNTLSMPNIQPAAQDTPLIMPVAKEISAISFEGGNVSLTGYALPQKTPAHLTAALRAAPHLAACANYADTAPEKPLRLIFCAEHLPTAIQAAACLSACHGADEEKSGQKDDVWDDLDAYLGLGENENEKDLSDLLVLADAAMLNPACADAESPLHIQLLMQKQAVLRNVWQQANALLLYSDDELPSQALLDFLAAAPQKSLFLAVRKRQFNRALLNQLCFEQGFRVCRLGTPSRSYQERVFRAVAAQEKVCLAPEVDLCSVLTRLERQRGALYSDADFALLLRRAVEEHGRLRPLTTEYLLAHDEISMEDTALQRLEKLIGLREVKDALRRIIAITDLENRRAGAELPTPPRCRNLVFSGESGTCKSVTARLLAQALQECGASSGAFVEAGREQLIGRYMGATSPMVAKLFERARGGVLFIDEAGALISHGGEDYYAEEAVNALVRHMELCPETTVIFATYPDEADTLLGQNPGLSSRIARVISFPSYTDAELCDIFAYLSQENGYRLPDGWRDPVADFAQKLRAQQRDRFGNGREMRRLLTEAIGELALRVKSGEKRLDTLSTDDLAAAARELLSETRRTEASIGF